MEILNKSKDQLSNNKEFWYAARTRANQEISIRNFLRKINIINFLATQIITKKLCDRVKEVEVPIIRNLIFIKTTKENAFALLNEYGLKMSYIRNACDWSMLVVPDKQMDDFMCVMRQMKGKVNTDVDYYAAGDKVMIMKGPLSGVEGILVKIDGKDQVMLRIQDVLAVSVKIPKTYLKKLA